MTTNDAQISMTEWLKQTKSEYTTEFVNEEINKTQRQNVLYEELGIPFDRPTIFSAEEAFGGVGKFIEFIEKRSDELCTFILLPNTSDLQKIRIKGKRLSEAHEWMKTQQVPADKYTVEIKPYSDKYLWSTIFVVNDIGVFGEIISGGRQQLTTGVYDGEPPIQFEYNFKNF